MSESLPVAERDVLLIDKIINDMMANLSVIESERPPLGDADALGPFKVQLDGVIAKGVDVLRKELKTDFVEKLHDRMYVRLSENDNIDLAYLAYRLNDSMQYIIAITGRYRGKPMVKAFDIKTAKGNLLQRGLWKDR